jgi:hypothetical protein
MFITCNTYRQASWAPDQIVFGAIYQTTSTITSTVGNTVFNNGNTQFELLATSATYVSSILYRGTSLVEGLVAGSVQSVGTTNYITSQTSLGGFAHVGISTGQSQIGSSLITNLTMTITGLYGTNSTVTSNVTRASMTSTSWTYNTTAGFTTSTTASTTGSTVGTTISTSTAPTAYASTGSSTTVGATTVTANIVSTTTATTTVTRWSTAAGNATVTTATSGTTISTATTATHTVNMTGTETVATPSWWGWSSEVGTVLVATGNGGSNDLPAWAYNSTAPSALWNFSFGSITTLWPAAPTATVGSVASTIFTNSVSQLISLIYSSSFTVFGSSSYTTTATDLGVSPFSGTGEVPTTTAGLPLPTVTVSVTSYSTFTSTVTATVQTPLDTSTFSTTNATAQPPTTTIIVSNLSIPAENSSFASTVTLTTLVNGYTTASAATGLGGGADRRSTAIISGPGLSVTTTTITQPWWYDTSCPTMTVGGTTPTAGGSGQTGTSVTSTSVFSTATFSGHTYKSTASASGQSQSYNSFSHNLFSTPSFVSSPFTIFTNSTGGSEIAPAAVNQWSASPPMQAFSPWTSTALTFLSISAPAILPAIPLTPAENGSWVSFDTLGFPVTSTATGLWRLWGSPATASYSTSTTSGTTTTGTTLTEIASFTWSGSSASASITTRAQIAFPADMDEQAASIYVTTNSSGASGSASYVGLTFTNSVTSTYCEWPAFTSTSNQVGTATTTGTVLIGLNTSSLLQTTTFQNSVTYTALTSNTNGEIQFFPGAGGVPKLNSGAATLYLHHAAVSILGKSSTTWSSADPNFFVVELVASATTSSSTTVNLGAGTFASYTIPGQVSYLTSPCFWFTTGQNRFQNAASVGTNFWNLPFPPAVPNQTGQLVE